MSTPLRTYTNPVYEPYFADPAVWRVGHTYFAVGTAGRQPDGRIFPLLRSVNLVDWEPIGGALIPPDDPTLGTDFWAPEVARGDDSRFYMYYSVGQAGEAFHQLRVAVSDTPEGPFTDIGGPPLVDREKCPFAIDAHPFKDDDGQWYLFYARDFLEAEEEARAGTALVVDRLLPDMTRLAGEEKTVLRPRYEWQRFQRDRLMAAYGGRVFDWHTLEGPFVVERSGLYYCTFSASAYHTVNYGVDYAVADSVWGPYADTGGEEGPRILRSIPDKVRGPGHHCIVLGPDDETQYIVYHAWNAEHTKRQMCVDRLLWTPDGGPRCDGPTTDPQPVPGAAISRPSP